ncbi:glycoside hydrolase family 3 protein [Luteococcus sp.]|uniref:glycoside hydrolase family 3 protein n=1 Tax=Luteococcus sp. TaxID=1969402 RepID=UPI0037354A05
MSDLPPTLSTTRRGVLAGLTGAAVVAGCPSPAAASPGSSSGGRPSGGPDRVVVPGTTPAQRAWAHRKLQQMSLDQKVGQVFNQYLYGSDARTVSEADAAENMKLYGVRTPAEVVEKYHLGGAIYFAWTHSVQDPEQIATLSNGLQRASLHANGVPLTISIDQENGVVTRMGPPATTLPGAMALGASRDPGLARTVSRVSGQELAAVGVTMNHAPDADVNVNPANPVIGVRSVSSDPQLVARTVAAQVRGLQSHGGVSATVKHFPGHGDTATDSHLGLPEITHSREEWERTDLPPFRAAIAAGVDSIMSGHLMVPALDPSGDPATLSRPIITGILREELGFQGLAITDGLMMEGVRQKYGDGEVAVRALLAGIDMLLMTPDMPAAWAAVHEAVASGRLPMERLDEAVLRNLQTKAKRGLPKEPWVDLDRIDRVVGTRQHQRVATAAFAATITLLRNQQVLPLAKDSRVAVVGWSSADTHTALADALRAHGSTVTTLQTGASPDQATIAEAVAAAREAQVTVVTTYNVTAGSAQAALVAALRGAGVKVVVVALRNPYDIAHFPEVEAYLASFAWSREAMRAVADVLVGRTPPAGKLPVAVPTADGTATLYPYGAGIGL